MFPHRKQSTANTKTLKQPEWNYTSPAHLNLFDLATPQCLTMYLQDI